MSKKLKKKDSPQSLAFAPENVAILSASVVRQGDNEVITKGLLKIITCTSNGKDQLTVFKQICIELKKVNGDNVKTLQELLSDMFIYCVGRHPLRRSISSYFQSVNEEVAGKLVDILGKKLQKHLGNVSSENREKVELISALMENFKTGDKVVALNWNVVLQFLHDAFVTFIDSAKNNLNVVIQTQMMHHCLATLKTMLAVLQKSQGYILLNNKKNEIGLEKLAILLNLATDVSVDRFMTLECCSAAAMMIPAIALHLSKGEIYTVLNNVNNNDSENIPLNVLLHKVIESTRILVTGENSSLLILLHAFLVKLPASYLHTTIEKDNCTYIEQLFIDQLFTISMNSHNKHVLVLAFKTITLWVTNATQPINDQRNSHMIDLFKSKVIPHLLNYVNYPIDTIRHNVNKALTDSFQFLTSSNSKHVILELSQHYFKGSIRSRGTIMILKTLSQFVSISQLLLTKPNLTSEVIQLLSDVDLSSHGCDLYKVLSEYHYKEIENNETLKNDWINIWVNNTFVFLNGENKEIKKGIVEYIIPSLLRIYPTLVKIYINEITNDSCLIKSRVAIVLLKSYRSLKNNEGKNVIEFQSDERKDMWKSLLPMKYMQMFCTHNDEQVCLDTISLICSSVKTTDPVDSNDILLIKHFLHHNLPSESPAFRQQLITNIKKILLRLFGHAYQIQQQVESSELQVLYPRFFEWLVEFCIDHLYGTAPYSQVSTTLELLSLVTLISYENKASQLMKNIQIAQQDKMKNTKILLECFTDTYDPNRNLVYHIFKNQPVFCCDLSFEDTMAIFNDALVRLCSPQPDISSVAAYYVSYLAMKVSPQQLRDLLQQNQIHIAHNYFSESEDTVAMFLDLLLTLLQTQLDELKTNLYKGAQSSPLYGVLYTIRLLFTLESLNMNHTLVTQHIGEFKEFLHSLINTYIDIIELVAQYVSSDAPEGHLNDANLGEIFQLLNLDLKETNIEIEAHIARMLLVCCWRSMKEVSLLLGAVVSSFSGNKTHDDIEENLLPKDLLMKIWEMFCNILLRSKHAGAYELASLGYVKLCTVLWNSNDADIKIVPNNAVVTLVKDLMSSETYDKAQVTRRSAGLPFYLKALCTTEPIIKSKQSFKYLMTSLIEICSKHTASHDVNKLVIALNILRAFFKDANLCEDVYEFVGDGVIIAIKGFSSIIWAIRNSSTLLFSALMQRIFGVKKFKMTGREFFSRYPLLYEFLLNEANCMSDITVDKLELHPSIFPVLLMLSHLYPSFVEGAESLMKLKNFIPHVLRCGSSAIYKTRTMAARAVVPLISKENTYSFIISLLTDIKETFTMECNENLLHGRLLQVSALLQHFIADKDDAVEIKCEMIQLLSFVGLQLQNKGSFLAKSTFTDILNMLLKTITTIASNDIYQRHLVFTKEHLNNLSHSRCPGYMLFVRNASQFICSFYKSNYNQQNKVLPIKYLFELLNVNETEVQITVLQFMQDESSLIQSASSDLEVGSSDLFFNEMHLLLFYGIMVNTNSKNTLFYMVLKTISSIILSLKTIQNSDVITKIWQRVSTESKSNVKMSDELQSSVVEFLYSIYETQIILDVNIQGEFMKESWSLLQMSSLDGNTECTRLNVAKVVGCVHLNDMVKNTDVIYRYYHCCITLLRDADLLIRNTAAENIYQAITKQSTADAEIFYKPQPSVVMEKYLEKQLRYQLTIDSLNCLYFLLSIITETDYYEDGNPIDEKRSENILKNFVVFEESKSNPYFDQVLVCKFVINLLTDHLETEKLDIDAIKDDKRFLNRANQGKVRCNNDKYTNFIFIDFLRLVGIELFL